MNEDEFTGLLFDLLEAEGIDTRTFERAGLMTGNTGIVARFADGKEFQVTIVQSN